MKCYECGGTYVKHKGALSLPDRCVGSLYVVSIEYLKCDNCDDYLFSPEAARRIEDSRKRLLDEILQSMPLSDFASAAKTADALGISRQALHKHRRIRRGFIFQTQFDDKTVYLKESIKQFQKTGDGRFSLQKLLKQPKCEDKKETRSVLPAGVYENKTPPSSDRWDNLFVSGSGQTVPCHGWTRGSSLGN